MKITAFTSIWYTPRLKFKYPEIPVLVAVKGSNPTWPPRKKAVPSDKMVIPRNDITVRQAMLKTEWFFFIHKHVLSNQITSMY